jgi:hypothetical protein
MYLKALVIVIWHERETIINKAANIVLYKCMRVSSKLLSLLPR